MRTTPLGLALLLALLLGGPAAADDAKPTYPTGRSTQEIEGLKVELGVPENLTKDKPGSMLVILHGSGGSAVGMAASMRQWVPEGYVVVAPKSSGQVWSDSDVARVKKIIQHLQSALPVDKARLHVAGYSNGGWNLPPLAFDDDLKPVTATYIASGYRGGKAPKWAKDRGVIALAGTRDANAASARDTVKMLRKTVGAVEARFQQNLGHEWPGELMPYLRWWMGAREGRCTPGVDLNFKWSEDLDRSLKLAGRKKKGGVFLYAYDSAAEDHTVTKELQTRMFMDPLVRHFGGQLLPTKLDAKTEATRLEGYGVTSYPAIILLKPDGTVKKLLEGKNLQQRKVLAALRSLAPDRKKPEGY